MSRYESHLHKIGKENQERHFRKEMGMHELPKVRKLPDEVYKLREESINATPERKIEMSKILFERGIIGELEYKNTVKRYGKD